MRKNSFKNYLISFSGVFILLVFLYLVINFIPPFSSYHTYVIQTPSMTPTINVGDLVFIKETDSINDYKTGDIIAFYTNINATEEDEVVVHYLAQITTDQDGIKTFKSKPEVSDDLDSWTLEESDLIGIYDFKISGIGNALMFFKTIPGMVLLIINVWLIFYVIDVFKKNNK